MEYLSKKVAAYEQFVLVFSKKRNIIPSKILRASSGQACYHHGYYIRWFLRTRCASMMYFPQKK